MVMELIISFWRWGHMIDQPKISQWDDFCCLKHDSIENEFGSIKYLVLVVDLDYDQRWICLDVFPGVWMYLDSADNFLQSFR